MSELAEHWRRGTFRAAYEESARAVGELATSHPFRDTIDPIAHAQRLHDHGRLCWRLARFDDAQRALERAVELRSHALGAEHEATLDSRERLAAVADHQLRDDAVARYEDVVAALARSLGNDHHVRVAIARRNLAACLRDRGQLGAARAAIDRALATFDAELPPEHPDAVDALKVDAYLLLCEGNARSARRAATHAIELAKRAWDIDHPFVAGAELTLASAELQQNELARARERLVRVADVFERAYGPTHPLFAIALNVRARVERRDDDLPLAESFARRAIAAFRETYAGPPLVAIARTLVHVLIAVGDLTGASAELDQLAAHASPAQRRDLASRLALALERAGSDDAAAVWRARAEAIA